MFEKLKQRWNVNGLRLTIVILTFATGGSLTGYAGKKLMGLLPISNGVLWTITYIIVITIIWPVIMAARSLERMSLTRSVEACRRASTVP